MLAAKVEDMLNTVVRQIAFYEFERSCMTSAAPASCCPSASARSGWRCRRKASARRSISTPEYRLFWAYVPHFIHSPFYVYAYAFGDCLVNALYAVFQESADNPASSPNICDMLRAGGTKRHKELLAPFGLDASDPHSGTRGWT